MGVSLYIVFDSVLGVMLMQKNSLKEFVGSSIKYVSVEMHRATERCANLDLCPHLQHIFVSASDSSWQEIAVL